MLPVVEGDGAVGDGRLEGVLGVRERDDGEGRGGRGESKSSNDNDKERSKILHHAFPLFSMEMARASEKLDGTDSARRLSLS